MKELAAAKLNVMRRVSYIQKDKQMAGGQSYRYLGIEGLIGALRPVMVEEGLVWSPSGMDVLSSGFIKTRNGEMNHVRIKVKYTVTHAATGQMETIEAIGEGSDSLDKSANKAMTAAEKYALLQLFLIETGNDPDDTASPPPMNQTHGPAPKAAPTKDWSAMAAGYSNFINEKDAAGIGTTFGPFFEELKKDMHEAGAPPEEFGKAWRLCYRTWFIKRMEFAKPAEFDAIKAAIQKAKLDPGTEAELLKLADQQKMMAERS